MADADPGAATAVISASRCVVRAALDRHAAEKGDEIYAVFEGGDHWTFADTLARVRRVAAGLQALGVGRGDHVLLMLPNGPLGITLLLAVNYLGAVFVPINPAYRGALLAHVVMDSGSVLAVVHPDAAERLLAVEGSFLRHVVVAAPDTHRWESPQGIALSGLASLAGDLAILRPLDPPLAPWDLQSIIYTSGTTGRSKGVLSTYMHSFSACNPEAWRCTRADDRHLLHMPIFHIGGAFVACTALCVGASIGVVAAFRTDTFWASVRELGITSAFLLGAMATFLLKQPPSPNDRAHGLRHVMIVPLGTSGPVFRARFGVDVFTLFNMTEICTPLMSEANPAKPNSCGRPRYGLEVRLVDAHDMEVPDGAVGELVVRTAAPWAMSHGYHANPAATAAAWRNGWFHTGDAFIRDSGGDFFFVDRLKDSIRRRGENISSYELELELLSHPSVREAAAVAVPSAHGEDEVLAVLAPVAGQKIDPAGMIAYLRGRLAPFMVPRYIRVLPELPKTPTAKVEKHVLRATGCTPDTWDRVRAGIIVRRETMSEETP